MSAFRVGYSCPTALLNVTNNIIGDADDSQTIASNLLVYSKALDTLDHDTLEILSSCGMSVDEISLFASYLTNQFQCKWVISNSLKFLSGVPPGSILEPLFSSAYTSQFILSIASFKLQCMRMILNSNTHSLTMTPNEQMTVSTNI